MNRTAIEWSTIALEMRQRDTQIESVCVFMWVIYKLFSFHFRKQRKSNDDNNNVGCYKA